MIDLNRRDMLKLSGAAVGGLALGNVISGCSSSLSASTNPAQTNTLFDNLPVFPLGEKLASDEMRITFLGTSCIPRLSQECNSIFVEVGSGDQFVFDCGTGIAAKYNALGIPMSKMDKIFLTHLHADHMSDLTHIYCFGPAEDRKSPLYVWGPGNSGFTYISPEGQIRGPYNDGLTAFCQHFREVMRWHTESFSFGATEFINALTNPPSKWGIPIPSPVGTDDPNDGYALYPIELDWTLYGKNSGDNICYNNTTTGVTISHFPAIHCRRGSISYKLQWNGMSMIFSGDTKPNYNMIHQASGVDVLIHEMVVPADVWTMKNLGITDPSQVDPAIWQQAYNYAKSVQDSSHTPQGAFGYLLSQINPNPGIAIATHFQAADDTMASATTSVRNHYPTGAFTFACDLMVFNVSKTQIRQRRAVVSDFAFYPVGKMQSVYPPLYWAWDDPNSPNRQRVSDPLAQIDTSDAVPQKDQNGQNNWDPSGY
ncbi:MAG: MBL fold metallo-hydrolase [Dissulfurispiraceae bacterium]